MTDSKMISIRRGDVFYIAKQLQNSDGSVQEANRPAVVISNNTNNKHSDVFQVVFLTTAPKTDLPTHCKIRSTRKVSTALCEQIHSISRDRFQTYITTLTDQELAQIEICVLISLGIDIPAPKVEYIEKQVPVEEIPASVKETLAVLKAENKLLQKQYDSFLTKFFKYGVNVKSMEERNATSKK